MCSFLAVSGELLWGKSHVLYILLSLYALNNACHCVCGRWINEKIKRWMTERSCLCLLRLTQNLGQAWPCSQNHLQIQLQKVEEEEEEVDLRLNVSSSHAPEEFHCRFHSFDSCDSVLPLGNHPSPSITTVLPRGNSASHQRHKNPQGFLRISSLLSHGSLMNLWNIQWVTLTFQNSSQGRSTPRINSCPLVNHSWDLSIAVCSHPRTLVSNN